MTTHDRTTLLRAQFKDLHRSGCFVIPNPWDLGSARYLASLGFKALATTSSGFAWTIAHADNQAGVDDVLAHLQKLTAAVDLPVNADFEDGFSTDTAGVEANVARACAAGIAGLSIEDSTPRADQPLRSLADSVARIRAARRAIDAAGGDVILVGRAENFIAGRPDLDDTVARLCAYADAGADCLYAPGLTTDDQVAAVVRAVAPKPVNVLVGQAGFTVERLAALGVRRISVGGALARSAWGAFMAAAREIADHGTFGCFAHAASGRDINALMARPD
ncbi:MAG: isocitrate lyase/phosphoenolpyruvate mutase family protein [Proteobacteria bacterium]|nr:isocitrate lyase/phosphoenolpyruvate mutase family protein [Pseudomonadota bacterium]